MSDREHVAAALVCAAAAGDETAFSQMLVRHHDAMLRGITASLPRHLWHVVSPEDLLQETFVEAFPTRGSLCYWS